MPRSHIRYLDACRAALERAAITQAVHCVVLLPDRRYHVWPETHYDHRWPDHFTIATPDGAIIPDGTIERARETSVRCEGS